MSDNPSLKSAITELAKKYITKLDIARIRRDIPASSDKNVQHIWFARRLTDDKLEVSQRVGLVGEQAKELSLFISIVVDTLSRHKDYFQQPERVTVEIIYDALAWYVYNNDCGRPNADSIFINELAKGLCGGLSIFRFLVPIRNLTVTEEVQIDEVRILPPSFLAGPTPVLERLRRCDERIRNCLSGKLSVNCSFADIMIEARSDAEALRKVKIEATELFLLLRYCIVLNERYYISNDRDWSPYIDSDVLPIVLLGESNEEIRSVRLPGFMGRQEAIVSIDQDIREVNIVNAGLLSRSLSKKHAKSYASDVYQAILWASRSHDETDSNTRLIFLVAALEAVIPAESKSEIAFRVSILSALLLKKAGRDPSDTSARVRRAYELRSKLVHGGNVTVPHVIVDQLSHIVEDIIKLQLESEDVESLLRSKPKDYYNELQNRLLTDF